MGKKFLPPLLALVGGGAGFALRKWQLATGFEGDTGLAVPGAPAATAAAVCSVLVVLALLLLCWRGEKKLSWETAFAAGRQNSLAVTALILGAMLLFASGGAELVARSVNGAVFYEGETAFARTTSRILSALRIVLGIGALPCVFLWARALFRGEGGKENLAVLEPCLLYCVWLISTYQTRSADPVVQDYLYEVLAIVTSLLGLYFIAGHAFGNGKPRQALFFSLAGTYFSLVTLADGYPLTDSFRYLFAALYLTAHAALILNHPPVEEQDATAEAETEADENAG